MILGSKWIEIRNVNIFCFEMEIEYLSFRLFIPLLLASSKAEHEEDQKILCVPGLLLGNTILFCKFPLNVILLAIE